MDTIDYVKPADVAAAMVEAGKRKLALAPRDLLIRGMLSGAILGVATSLAFTGAVQTNVPLVGALIFPVGLISIVLLGLELVTGSFALVPLPWLGREASAPAVLVNWGWVFIGNLIGSVAYGALIAIALTNMGSTAPAGVAARIVQVAEAKTIGYSALGFAGMVTVFVKAMLVQLDGLPRDRAGHDYQFRDRQDRLRLDAGFHLFRAGLRALGRQYVHRADRHDDGR